jgi:hypothetical protein
MLAQGFAIAVQDSDAVRSALADIDALVDRQPASQGRPKPGRDKSAAMAGRTIDILTDPAATPEDRAKRKRRLLKGPSEFRDMRDDQPGRSKPYSYALSTEPALHAPSRSKPSECEWHPISQVFCSAALAGRHSSRCIAMHRISA